MGRVVFVKFLVVMAIRCGIILGCGLILPGAEYSTYIGGANQYQVARVAVDAAGNTYIAGTRLLDQASDIFVMKLDGSGSVLLFRTIGGQGNDVASDMAVDAAGNIYVAGSTNSLSFPVHNALQSTSGPGFIVKFSADGNQIVWSTYFRENINALAIDSSGNVYVAGSTVDPNFPVTPGLPQGPASHDLGFVSGAFLTKISAAGDRIVYSTVIIGGAVPCQSPSGCTSYLRETAGVSVAVDPLGNAYLAGNSNTSNIPTTSGAFLGMGWGAFVAAVKADGSRLLYLTYIGAGSYPDDVRIPMPPI